MVSTALLVRMLLLWNMLTSRVQYSTVQCTIPAVLYCSVTVICRLVRYACTCTVRSTGQVQVLYHLDKYNKYWYLDKYNK